MCKTKKRAVYTLLFSFYLAQQWILIFFFFSGLFVAARQSAPLSYFQVDIFAGGVGRCTALFAGGVTLDFVTGLGSEPGRERERENIFLLCERRVWWHFLVLPFGGAERIRVGLVSSTACYNLPRPCLKKRHKVSCKSEDGCVLTFSLECCGLLLDGANM